MMTEDDCDRADNARDEYKDARIQRETRKNPGRYRVQVQFDPPRESYAWIDVEAESEFDARGKATRDALRRYGRPTSAKCTGRIEAPREFACSECGAEFDYDREQGNVVTEDEQGNAVAYCDPDCKRAEDDRAREGALGI